MTAAWSAYPESTVQVVLPEHPTVGESRNAAFEFAKGLAETGHGNISVVVFGAASIRHHYPNFRSTPVRL